MEKILNLIKNEASPELVRNFPRFPFTYMVFKCAQSAETFEIQDISESGMQISLKSGELSLGKNSQVTGNINWNGDTLQIEATVVWVKGMRAGLRFVNCSLHEFLSLARFAQNMKDITAMDMDLSLPRDLSLWLRSDGPCELFVWIDNNHNYSEFQIVFMDRYVEWSDGEGVKTGRVISKRDLQTPLLSQDQYIFKTDSPTQRNTLQTAQQILQELIKQQKIYDCFEFISRQLRH